MRWKTVALAGALGTTATGCNIIHDAAHTLINEPLVVHNQHSITHDLRKQANAAWKEVRSQYPRRAFTSEFHDGFTDGYVDFLDRGGNGSIPAVPPVKYTRHKKYFTENGQCLVKDYFLGFKYGQDIAIATGKRQFLTVPVLLPVEDDGPPAFKIQPPAGSGGEALPAPTPVKMPVPTPPPSPTPVPTPAPTPPQFQTPEAVGSGASLNPPERPRITITNTIPIPVAPVPPAPATAPVVTPAPSPPAPVRIPQVPTLKLPPPPREVPEFPEYVPTPPVTDDLPIVAPNTKEFPVVPPSHPDAK